MGIWSYASAKSKEIIQSPCLTDQRTEAGVSMRNFVKVTDRLRTERSIMGLQDPEALRVTKTLL